MSLVLVIVFLAHSRMLLAIIMFLAVVIFLVLMVLITLLQQLHQLALPYMGMTTISLVLDQTPTMLHLV